ncbi:MAG: phosphatidate cytidylyltransferase [Butyricicoccus pullicaecorum]|nr:phosphatidate cytidylyltransferase [Butyricicoccus pullicaecorum]
MKARVLFGVGGFLFVLLALYVLPPIVLALAVSALCVCASYELIVPTGLVKNRAMQRVTLAASAMYAAVTCIPSALLLLPARMAGGGFAPQAESFTVFAILGDSSGSVSLTGAEMRTYLEAFQQQFGRLLMLFLLVGLFACLLRHHDTVRTEEVMAGFVGGFILPALLLSLWRIFEMEGGAFLVLLPLVAAWGSDTCALFAGMAFGKHKLAPVVSPKKTVEGAVGGVIGATLLMLGVVFLMNRYAGLSIHYAGAAVMGAAGAAIGQLGDLSFSIIKRQCKIKDYSHIFPGHGGVLDRFDSVIFVAPVIELVLSISFYLAV